MMNRKRIILLFVILASTTFAQKIRIDKVEPPCWWEGMKYNNIQLMVYGKGFNDVEVKSDGLEITNIHKVENSNYIFIDIDASNTQSGSYKINIVNNHDSVSFMYQIKSRVENATIHQGFSNDDAIYLIMPDRFANGDTSNDFVEGYIDTFQNQYSQARHGGDIKGVINRLDYIKELGFTTIWLTPLIENNTFRSYHGYSATDFYKIDPRLGNLKTYKTLINKAHEKGLKIIMDHVSNHIAIDHPWIKDLPTDDWINGSVEHHLLASHHKMVFTDPYSDSSTIKHVQEGWFVDYMPDLNHKNKFVQNYIIQNTLWWIEQTGVDGIREDTYPYCDQEFMSNWAKVILREYPTFNIVGEVWTGEPEFLSGYQKGNKLRKYDTNLPAVTDFGMRDVLVNYLSGKELLYKFYTLLATDYLYPNSDNLVTFIDNHDVGRAMLQAGSDIEKFKIAFHLLLTTRGIPQVFYGTEIGMKETEDHGTLRKNFPGGFPDDIRNAFTEEGRTEYENDIYNFFRQMLSLRKSHPALRKGKLIHFPPVDNVYVYFKKYEDELIMNIVNAGNNKAVVDLEKYQSVINGRKKIINLKTDEKLSVQQNGSIVVEKGKAEMYLIK